VIVFGTTVLLVVVDEPLLVYVRLDEVKLHVPPVGERDAGLLSFLQLASPLSSRAAM
jgi:hypothetical protein